MKGCSVGGISAVNAFGAEICCQNSLNCTPQRRHTDNSQSFFGHMKYELGVKKEMDNDRGIKRRHKRLIDYFNKNRYQMELSKLSPI